MVFSYPEANANSKLEINFKLTEPGNKAPIPAI